MNCKCTWVYFVACRRGQIYVGVATDPIQRFRNHCLGRGAKHLRLQHPDLLIGALSFPTRTEALIVEYRIKRLPRLRKLQLAAAASVNDAWMHFLHQQAQRRGGKKGALAADELLFAENIRLASRGRHH